MFYNKTIHDRTFCERRYFISNIRLIKQYLKDINFLVKNGYDKSATYDLDIWFMSMMKEILPSYKNRDCVVEIDSSKTEKENMALWQETIDKMIDLLNRMDRGSEIYNDVSFNERERATNKAKNEFFKLFSKYFYEFWD